MTYIIVSKALAHVGQPSRVCIHCFFNHSLIVSKLVLLFLKVDLVLRLDAPVGLIRHVIAIIDLVLLLLRNSNASPFDLLTLCSFLLGGHFTCQEEEVEKS